MNERKSGRCEHVSNQLGFRSTRILTNYAQELTSRALGPHSAKLDSCEDICCQIISKYVICMILRLAFQQDERAQFDAQVSGDRIFLGA